jgi:hypothetical protein
LVAGEFATGVAAPPPGEGTLLGADTLAGATSSAGLPQPEMLVWAASAARTRKVIGEFAFIMLEFLCVYFFALRN